VRHSTIPHLIIINALVWLAGFRLRELPYYLALHKAGTSSFEYWQILTYFFTHQSFWHILANMIVLWSLGTPVEERMGPPRFLRFYLVTGLLAGVFLAYLDPSPAPVLGASTATSGLLSALATYFPKGHLLIFPIPIPIQARWLALGFGVVSLVLFLLNPEGGGVISHLGHLLGLGIGYLYLLLERSLRL
jgi:membrane associated rhomboid family serine protease